ncbi:MAG: response regulator [Candidatus Sulfotelmatobacter sp.]
MGFNVLVVESDSRLTGSLSSHFHSVHLTRTGEELRQRVAKNRPQAVILNIEQFPLSDIRNLRHEFPSLPIVCAHRIPDEELWVAALEAGASDVCSTDDVQNVLAAVLRNSASKAAVA